MGDVFGAIFGGGGTEKTDNTIDPQSQAANKLRVQQLQSLFGAQPLTNFAQPRPDIYTGSPAVDNLFSTANSSYNLPDQSNPVDYDNLMSFEEYKNLGLDQGSNYINQVARPEIMQTAALQGLEQSGFVADAVARATASIALPFLQTLPSASTALTLARPQAEGIRADTDLTNAQRSLTGPQAGVLNAQRASTLFPLADYSRGLTESDFLRQQSVGLAGLTGIPFTPVTDSVAKKNSQPFFNFFGQG